MKQNVISLIRSSTRSIIRELGFLDDRFSAIGSISQCHALIEIHSMEKINSAQLSAALDLEKSTTSRLVAQLLKKGLCQTTFDGDDRRNKLLTLTKKGIEMVSNIHKEADLQVKMALDMMNEEEQTIINNGLHLYALALQRARLHNDQTISPLQYQIDKNEYQMRIKK